MKPMSPEAQALLDAARTAGETPPAGAQERIRGRLDARIAAGDPGPNDMLPVSSGGLVRRVLLTALLLAGIAIGIFWKKTPEAQVSTPSARQAPRVAAAAPSAIPPAAIAAPPPVAPAPEVVPARPAPAAPRRSIPRVAAVPPAPVTSQAPPEKALDKEASCGMAGEVKLLQQAERDLQDHKAEVVLAALQQASKACPGQGLEQERLALRILALCQLGRATDAQTDAAKLEKEAPQSPSLGRIHAECGDLLSLP